MHIINQLLHLCVLASTVSAFYPYVPEYECIQDGSCTDASKRGFSIELAEAIGGKGSFEVKLKQRQNRPNGQTPEERASPRLDSLLGPFKKRENTYLINESKDPSLPNSAPIAVGGFDYSYMGIMKFGSPGKELNMLLDTGASTSWVMGSTCVDKPCTHHNVFGKADSTSYVESVEKFSANYGSGNVSGVWGKDNVEFAGLKVPLEFGVADEVFESFSAYPMDGILGLAVDPKSKKPGFLAYIINNGLIKAPIFGVNLQRSADETNDGSIVFGDIDSSKVSGAVAYTPLRPEHPGVWMITTGDAGIGGKNGGLAGKKAIIDTGTSYCFLPPDDAAKFYSTFPDARVSKNGAFYTVPCDTTTPAQFTFGGITFEVPAKDWVDTKAKVAAEDGRCTSNIFSRDATGSEKTKLNAWLMGDTFLKNVYQVYDVGQQRIGFAKKAIATSSTSSSASAATGTTALSSYYKIPSRHTSTGKNFPFLTRTEDLETASSAETSSSSSTPFSDIPSSTDSSKDAPSDTTSDTQSTDTTVPTSTSTSTLLDTSTRTTPDESPITESSSATATQTGPTMGAFTGFIADGEATAAADPAATPSETSAPSTGAATLLTTSLALIVASFLAFTAILI